MPLEVDSASEDCIISGLWSLENCKGDEQGGESENS